MTDRPVIFSGQMIRALLDNRKTQARRLVSSPLAKCQIGDRLWVRENFTPQTNCTDGVIVIYGASRSRGGSEAKDLVPLPSDTLMPRLNIQRPSIHMPRWASRLTLVVTDVRRQRLQDISARDCAAEGCRLGRWDMEDRGTEIWMDHGIELDARELRQKFANLWDSLYGHKPGQSWADNPEIVALTFEVHRVNIDRMGV